MYLSSCLLIEILNSEVHVISLAFIFSSNSANLVRTSMSQLVTSSPCRSSSFNDVPRKPAAQLNTTLSFFRGWYTPWWGIYQTWPSWQLKCEMGTLTTWPLISMLFIKFVYSLWKSWFFFSFMLRFIARWTAALQLLGILTNTFFIGRQCSSDHWQNALS